MADRPLIFSAPMVRALLDGRKCQTRRILKPQPIGFPWFWEGDEVDPVPGWFDGYEVGRTPCGAPEREVNVPLKGMPYAVGDRLWCREAWRLDSMNDDTSPADFVRGLAEQGMSGPNGLVRFEADERDAWGDEYTLPVGRLRPSIHLPRQLSRLTLVVTEVRVQRVQEISEADARAEGVGLYVPGHGFITDSELRADPGYSNFLSPRAGFEALWTEIHGPGAWQRNDWVAALTFDVHRANIADVPEAA